MRGLEIVLVTTDRVQYDDAMSAGILRGVYSEAEARIDVGSLAARAGASVAHARADRLNPQARVVHAGAERIAFDLCSIDEVGPPLGSDLPGVREHAVMLRPASGLMEARRAIEARLADGANPVRCTIVGGGSTGVECAFAIQRLLRARPGGGVVTIVDGARQVLDDLAPCREPARRALERVGVCFALGAPVVAVRADGVMLASGGLVPSDLVIWTTGGAPPKLIVDSGLPHDARGRLLVDARLRARFDAPIWAAGDCAAIDEPSAWDPRRHGELLERELRAHLGAPRRRLERPRAHPPCLLDTGDGRAIVQWGPWAGRSHLAGWLKRRLDRSFVASLGEP